MSALHVAISHQGCGSGYFSTAFTSTPIASASTNKKRQNDRRQIFLNFCGSIACLLLHFIILRRQKPLFIAITLCTLYNKCIVER